MEIRVKIEKWQAFSMLFAIVLLTGVIIGVSAFNSSPAVPSSMGHSANEIDWTGVNVNDMINWSKTISQLLINPSTDANLRIGKNISFNGAVSISATNDANTVNTPLEIRASKTLFTYGDVCVNTASGERCLSSAGSSYRAYNSGWIYATKSCNEQCGGAEMVLFSYAQNPDGSQMEISSSWVNPGLYGRCVCIIRV